MVTEMSCPQIPLVTRTSIFNRLVHTGTYGNNEQDMQTMQRRHYRRCCGLLRPVRDAAPPAPTERVPDLPAMREDTIGRAVQVLRSVRIAPDPSSNGCACSAGNNKKDDMPNMRFSQYRLLSALLQEVRVIPCSSRNEFTHGTWIRQTGSMPVMRVSQHG